ncbi:hypothetical protein [Micromonospora sp. KLBMP9576]|uniref:hypothetical protein n=1 Tax=Micromonospora sp. KLBMP9576 TaxID=3424769 RepID=UPI003D8F1AF6
MSHQLFDELIGTPPPARVDVAGIIRRERRARAGRRLAGSLAAVLTLAVAGSVGWAARGPQPDHAAGPPPPLAASAAPVDTRFRLAFDTRRAAAVSTGHLNEAFGNALRDVVPQARWFRASGADAREPDGDLPTLTYDGRNAVSGMSGVFHQGRRGILSLSVHPFVAGPASPASPANPDNPAHPVSPRPPLGQPWSCEAPPGRGERAARQVCEESATPGGLRMAVETLIQRESGSVQHRISIRLPGNRVFGLTASNMTGVDRRAEAAQPEAPLSAAQLTAIAVRITEQIRA